MKDFLILLSDQHDGRIQSHSGDPLVRTPNLDALAADGVSFSNAYTPCPLCIPARMSLLSTQLPCHTGVFTNSGSLHPEMPTFLHSLAVAGYETVLCGRMHFEGADQRHGFTKRIADDITPTAFGSLGRAKAAHGIGSVLMTGVGCLYAVGGGNSVTLDYDRYVVEQALTYLSQPHEKPQCIVVGTYGPHHPYIAPEELYHYYLDKVSLPENLDAPAFTPAMEKPTDRNPELVRAVRAAYYGMVEFEDECIGKVRTAWDSWLKENDRTGVFAYISDHGDHIGERGFYGKQTLYEPSLRVPMLFAGDGIPAGTALQTPVSLLDIGPTLLELAGAEPMPSTDGRSLAAALADGTEPEAVPVIAEWINGPYTLGTEYGRMVRLGSLKYAGFVNYPEEDLLTEPANDRWELNNLAAHRPEDTARLRSLAFDGLDIPGIVEAKNRLFKAKQLLARFNKLTGGDVWEVWGGSEGSRTLPRHYIKSSQPVSPRFRDIVEAAEQAAAAARAEE